jgi:hypothetical protein
MARRDRRHQRNDVRDWVLALEHLGLSDISFVVLSLFLLGKITHHHGVSETLADPERDIDEIVELAGLGASVNLSSEMKCL